MFEGLVTIPAVKRKKKTGRFYKKRNKRFLENAAKREKRVNEQKFEYIPYEHDLMAARLLGKIYEGDTKNARITARDLGFNI